MNRLVGVGVFVVGGVLLFAVGLFMIGDRRMAFTPKFTVYTHFDRITGLQPGSVVRISGARAGEVRGIEPPRDPSGRFRVELEVSEDLHALVRTDSTASIEAEGLVGGSYLGVSIGSSGAPIASVGATLPSREPFEIGDLLQQMSATIVKANAAVDVLTAQVQEALDAVVVTVDNANAVITAVSDDAAVIASATARVSGDLAEITAKFRTGKGTIPRLLDDEELYSRIAATVAHGETMAADAERVVAGVREVVDRFRSGNDDIGGLTVELRRTLSEARGAMSGLADNMDALKRNFLFRGYFNRRGFFDLDRLSPDEYRQGALSSGGRRTATRIWLTAERLFATGAGADPVLSDEGRARLESALATYLDRLPGGVLMVEGHSRQGERDDQYTRSRAFAVAARDYLITRFDLDADRTGVMPLADRPVETPELESWVGEGISLAYFPAPPR